MPIKAVIFDLDGVVTDTAQAHAVSWKTLFDGYLLSRESKYSEKFHPFDLKIDYLTYVDGKPRYDGVRAFLDSRNINLPYGDSSDPPGNETICGLGNKKNLLFQEQIKKNGVTVYPKSLEWIRTLKSQGIKVAMSTSSKNAPLILEKGNLVDLFDATVDGNDSERLNLKGKPEPDIFLENAKTLNLPPDQCAVVEDAVSGVQAGKNGKFGVIIGITKTNPSSRLIENGADITVEDLDEISLDNLNKFLEKKETARE